jgi:hypothetical protein
MSSASIGVALRNQDGRSMPNKEPWHHVCKHVSRSGSIFTTLVVEPQQDNPIRIREENVDNGSFTGQCTSSPSSSWSRERHVWHVRKPHEHPHWSLLNIQGTCRHQSSCESPHPICHRQ